MPTYYNSASHAYNKLLRNPVSNNIVPGSKLWFDASLPTSTTSGYGYNTISGSTVTRLSNLSDPSGSSDAIYSNTGGTSAVVTIDSRQAITVHTLATPLFNSYYGFTCSVSFSSSTQSTMFYVTSSTSSSSDDLYIKDNTTHPAIKITDANIWHVYSNATVYGAKQQSLSSTGRIIKLYGGHNNPDSSSPTYHNTVLVNGVTSSTANNAFNNNGTYTSLLNTYVGNGTNTNKHSYLHELIYYDQLLNAADIIAIENYLKTKWGISY